MSGPQTKTPTIFVTSPPPENALLAAWKMTLTRQGKAPAVRAPSGEVLRTFAEIEAESTDFEAGFAGLPAHSVVAVQIGNDRRWPAGNRVRRLLGLVG